MFCSMQQQRLSSTACALSAIAIATLQGSAEQSKSALTHKHAAKAKICRAGTSSVQYTYCTPARMLNISTCIAHQYILHRASDWSQHCGVTVKLSCNGAACFDCSPWEVLESGVGAILGEALSKGLLLLVKALCEGLLGTRKGLLGRCQCLRCQRTSSPFTFRVLEANMGQQTSNIKTAKSWKTVIHPHLVSTPCNHMHIAITEKQL